MDNLIDRERVALIIDGYERSRTAGIRAVVKADELLELAEQAHANGRDAVVAEFLDRARDHLRTAHDALHTVDLPTTD